MSATPDALDIVPGPLGFAVLGHLNTGLDNYYVRRSIPGPAAYDVAATDTIIAVTGVAGGTINLPSIDTHVKLHQRLLVVCDEGGNAATVPLTLVPFGAEEIDGINANYVINWDKGAVILYSENDGPGWHVLSQPAPNPTAGAIVYTPSRPDDWVDVDPTLVTQALDRLAYAYFIAHGPVPVLP